MEGVDERDQRPTDLRPEDGEAMICLPAPSTRLS
ncbi:hypothetical protein ThimaDRAFT_3158 [Thiocapsa marina 5811]|uniref:Uncharacterized protein n=1 Tax=Thiocapsa marina 5811 TaxID=768671 RepID=F9UE56_9GAMM|nr:hypothetical protein ThimaDRAFT_3158 [Thiocapsa marina 5811]